MSAVLPVQTDEIVSYNPATGAEVGRVAQTSADDVTAAVDRGRHTPPHDGVGEAELVEHLGHLGHVAEHVGQVADVHGPAEGRGPAQELGDPALRHGVLEAHGDRSLALDALAREGRRAIDQDEAEVICLGCGGLLGLRAPLEERLKVLVIEAVPAAAALLQGLIINGLTTTTARAYQRPETGPVMCVERSYATGRS